MGLIPGMNTLFGMLPIHGHDVWLHAGTAAIAAYFGWRATEPNMERRTQQERRQRMLPVARERRLGLADRRQLAYSAAFLRGRTAGSRLDSAAGGVNENRDLCACSPASPI